MNFLFLSRGYLNELAADLDHNLNLAFRLRQSCDRLERKACIGYNIDCLLWKVKLAQMEVRLQVLQVTQ